MKERIYFNYAQRWKLRFDIQHYYRKKRRKSIAVTVAACITIALLFALPWLWQLKLDYDLTKTEESILSYSEVSTVLQELDMLQSDIAIMENFLQTTEEQSKNPRVVLGQVQELLPEGTTINSFSLQADNSLQLGMTLLGPPEVANLWINLRNSGLFEDFDIKNVSLVDQTQSIDLSLKFK